jgi:hypothetical protein
MDLEKTDDQWTKTPTIWENIIILNEFWPKNAEKTKKKHPKNDQNYKKK